MLALAFVSLLAAVGPDPVVVQRGETVSVRAAFSPQVFLYGAGFYAEDETIASVSGRIPVNGSSGTAAVTGLREGRTKLLLIFVSGFTVDRWPIADIHVTPCLPPTVTLDQSHARIHEGESLTVTAMTGGTPPVRVEWYEGQKLIGAGSPAVLSGLTRGRHHITAVVSNSCGSARSEELLIDVVVPRRRAARH
ncbi:MAG TPA: immunoglobulin domain-containing protein [Thermoanaerobaculia bacterium]